MDSKSFNEAIYVNEEPTKTLGIHDLIEAIHEYFDPTSDHDSDYLKKRILLLRETFNLGKASRNENVKVIDELLSGIGELPSLRLLPFDTLDTEAHIVINKQYETRINQVRASVREVQRAYITYIIIHAVESRLRSKTTTLAQLIAEGLPESDPGSDPADY
jgi:hypothetical protein